MIHNLKPIKIERITEHDKMNGCNYCSLCSHMATHKAFYQIEDAVIVEFYCDNCFKYMKEGRSKQVIDKFS